MNRTLLESAWLFHELGRCCLELGKFADASSYGEQSLDAASQASDENWQINSSVLIAQAEGEFSNIEPRWDPRCIQFTLYFGSNHSPFQ